MYLIIMTVLGLTDLYDYAVATGENLKFVILAIDQVAEEIRQHVAEGGYDVGEHIQAGDAEFLGEVVCPAGETNIGMMCGM